MGLFENTQNLVQVYPHWRSCGNGQGIPACNTVVRYSGNSNCGPNDHDIALVRLSAPMAGMRNIAAYLDTSNPRPRDWTIMAGTGQLSRIKMYLNLNVPGANNHNTCRSLRSRQRVVDCGCSGEQWYCTRGTSQLVSGGCFGDSGGPSWTFGQGNKWKNNHKKISYFVFMFRPYWFI